MAAVGHELQLHLAAEKVVRIQVAQNQICIGDGRFDSAAPVADGPGVRA